MDRLNPADEAPHDAKDEKDPKAAEPARITSAVVISTPPVRQDR